MEPELLTAERFVDHRIGCTYRYVVSKTEYSSPHYHEYYEIFLILEGRAYHMVGDQRILLDAGDLVFIRPHDTHHYQKWENTEFSMLNLTFDRDTAQAVFAFLGKGFPSITLCEAALPPIAHLSAPEMQQLRKQMERICVTDSADLERLRTALRVLLVRVFTSYFANAGEHHVALPAWLETLCEKMKHDGNFIEGSKKMRALAPCTREHLSRSMQKYLNMTVSEYVNYLRLNYVANLLQNSNLPIGTILLDAGFDNISRAIALFKQRYRVTPRDFRQNNGQPR